MRKLVIVFALLLSACTATKYTGTDQPELSSVACPLSHDLCSFRFGNVSGVYSLAKVSAEEYSLVGDVRWKDEEEANLLVVTSMDLYFIFISGTTVVHEEKVRISGDAGKKIPISVKFTTAEKFNKSVLASYRGRATE